MLALLGSGEYLPAVDIIDRNLIARLDAPARVVCLPTAAGPEGERVVGSWMQRGIDHFERLGASASALPVIDRASAHDRAHATAIDSANFVYLSGGNPLYLAETLAGTPVWEAIIGVHQRGGVLAGCSAGAMIMGERIAGLTGSREGFNLLPGTLIIPHFDEFIGRMSRIMRLFSDQSIKMIGIDGRTALVVEGDHYDVVGSGGVTLFSKGANTRYTQGAVPAEMLR
jgi:cyanophycinase